jgi:ferric-dicitrate binding protein FerR (iron transport regulator)
MKTQNKSFQPLEETILQYLTGSASDSEREIIIRWIHENKDHQQYFDECKALYLATKLNQKPLPFNREESWKIIQAVYYREKYMTGQVQQKKGRRKALLFVVISSAAAVVIAFLLGYYAFSGSWGQPSATLPGENEITVPLGAKSHITLSDGTRVWLNAGSKMKYPGVFSKESREVYLEGEAFFDVQKQAESIFTVRTSNLDIKVYGTQFNVKCYPDENQIQTTLVKGSISIEDHSDKTFKKPFILKPNQTAVYYKPAVPIPGPKGPAPGSGPGGLVESTEKMVITPVENPVPITSWKDNRWIIVSEELESLAIKLERRYNVKITFADESLKRYKFSGTLKDETFEQVLRIIQLSAPIVFHVDGNKVVFSEDPLYRKNYDKMISK